MEKELKDFIYDKNGWFNKDKPKVKPKNTNADLLFIFRGKTEVIKHNIGWGLAKSIQKRLEKDPQYRGGKFDIQYVK